jgi:uncharacterized protein
VTNSAIYEGQLHHARRAARSHSFRYRIALHYVDLDELDGLLGGRLVRARFGVLRFRRRDYFGPADVPLAEAVRAKVRTETGVEVDGPVRLLTQLRSFGHCFNPVSFYYCFDRSENVVAIVAEVNNTPWGERHAYVLVPDASGALAGSFPKQLHVSPFFGMNQSYLWHATPPADGLVVHLDNVEDGVRVFDATLSLRRHPFDVPTARRIARRYPFASLRTLALIYAHAVALRAKGVRFVAHPGATTP